MIAVALFGFFAGCVLFAVLCCFSSGQHPHQHPHRNSAEGTRGVGVDQFHNRSTSA